MTINPLAAVTNSISNVFDLDRRTQRELAAQADRAQAEVELTWVVTTALSQIFVCSEYQVSQAIKHTKAIEGSLEAAGIPAEEYLAYHRLLQHEYLQQMAMVTRKAMNEVNQQVK
jgi:hypothetical protein